MFTRKQFMSLYDQSVTKMKQLKFSNDKFNKNIGIQNDTYLLKQIQSENPIFDRNVVDLQQTIKKLQLNYLDPDTARKVGTLKQQLKAQKDRRSHLNSNIKTNAQIEFKSISLTNPPYKNNYSSPSYYNNMYLQSDKDNITTKPNLSVQSDRNQHQQIYQDTQMEEHIIKSKNKTISELQKSFINIHAISLETHRMTIEQGEKLDIIGQQMTKSHTNSKQANQHLSQANIHQQKSKKKYIVGSLFIILASIAIIVLISI